MKPSFRLREVREERGLTQKQVAEALFITRNAYTMYETGAREIPVSNLIKLADFYDCSTDELLGSEFYYEVILKENH